MAMISCPECGKEISSRANACPNCGCPIGDDAVAGPKQRVEVVEKVPVVEATPKACKVLQVLSALIILGGFFGCIAGGLDNARDSIGIMLVGLILYVVVGLYVWWNHR